MTDQELKLTMRQALDGTMPPLPDDPALTGKVLARYAEKQQTRQARMVGWRVVVSFAVIVLVVFSGVIMRTTIYVNEWDVIDENGHGHVIQSFSVDPPIKSSANANPDPDEPWNRNVFILDDWDEFVSELGMVPRVPNWLPDGWEYDEYILFSYDSGPWEKLVVITYKHPNIEYPFMVTFDVYRDISEVFSRLAQDESGFYVQLDNGLSVYIATITDEATSLWLDGNILYNVVGPVTTDELVQIIRSMYDFK